MQDVRLFGGLDRLGVECGAGVNSSRICGLDAKYRDSSLVFTIRMQLKFGNVMNVCSYDLCLSGYLRRGLTQLLEQVMSQQSLLCGDTLYTL